MHIVRPALLAVALSLSFACTQPQPLSKDRAADLGKGDDMSELCEEIGADPDCDLCEELDWYGDGACDPFCAEPDPDCALDCDTESLKYSACLESGAVAGGCQPAFGSLDYDELSRQCCTPLNDNFDESSDLCTDLAHAEECDLEDDFDTCVELGMRELDISADEAMVVCAEQVPAELAECCDAFPGTFACTVLPLIDLDDDDE